MEFSCAQELRKLYFDDELNGDGSKWTTFTETFEKSCEDALIPRDRWLSVLGGSVDRTVLDISEVLTEDWATYEQVKIALSAYFASSKGSVMRMFVFRKSCQYDHELLSSFVARLRLLAQHCLLTDRDNEILMQTILGCHSSKLQRRALKNSSLSVNDIIEMEQALLGSTYSQTAVELGKMETALEQETLSCTALRALAGLNEKQDGHLENWESDKVGHTSSQQMEPLFVMVGDIPIKIEACKGIKIRVDEHRYHRLWNSHENSSKSAQGLGKRKNAQAHGKKKKSRKISTVTRKSGECGTEDSVSKRTEGLEGQSSEVMFRYTESDDQTKNVNTEGGQEKVESGTIAEGILYQNNLQNDQEQNGNIERLRNLGLNETAKEKTDNLDSIPIENWDMEMKSSLEISENVVSGDDEEESYNIDMLEKTWINPTEDSRKLKHSESLDVNYSRHRKRRPTRDVRTWVKEQYDLPWNYVDERENLVLFFRKYSPFSQHHACHFWLDGREYNCTEQYMMYMKTVVAGDEETGWKILNTNCPVSQKQLAKNVRGLDMIKWGKLCERIVFNANWAKFTQNPHLRETLLETEPKILVEANPRDSQWGIGLEKEDPRAWCLKTWQGANRLGYILVQVRQAILRRDGHHWPWAWLDAVSESGNQGDAGKEQHSQNAAGWSWEESRLDNKSKVAVGDDKQMEKLEEDRQSEDGKLITWDEWQSQGKQEEKESFKQKWQTPVELTEEELITSQDEQVS